MRFETPRQAIDTLVAARNAGDIDRALACYEEGAVIVTAPGCYASGPGAIRGALEYFIALRAVFTVESSTIISGAQVCLHHSQWVLSGTGPAGDLLEIAGNSADVIQRQGSDGWLITIDNPWGPAYLG
jgi:ketosteroid isomerase-like protein